MAIRLMPGASSISRSPRDLVGNAHPPCERRASVRPTAGGRVEISGSLCRLCSPDSYLPMLKSLESYFEFTRLGTTWRTEILAGVTTFLTMAYIVLVNPAILSASGMPLAAVTAATCLSAAFGSILMGIVARYPIALAPGMGLNAYFTYTVCLKMHIPWQTALGAVFLSGLIFLALTAAGIRQMILRSIPHEFYAAVASGIGLFIAFIGFRNAGLIVADPETLSVSATSAIPPRPWPCSASSSWSRSKSKKCAEPSCSACFPLLPLPGAWPSSAAHRRACSRRSTQPRARLGTEARSLGPRSRRIPRARCHRLPTRHPRRSQQGPARNRLRVLLRRSL